MKKNTKILIAFTFICTIAFFIVMVMMIKENGKCVDHPFEYSAMRLKESGGNYECSCISLDPKLADFSFSEDGIKISHKSSAYIQQDSNDYSKFNVSNIKFLD